MSQVEAWKRAYSYGSDFSQSILSSILLNGLQHETSSLSYTQNGSINDPSKPHELSLIHRASDTPCCRHLRWI